MPTLVGFLPATHENRALMADAPPAPPAPPAGLSPLGIGMYSYGEAWRAARNRIAGVAFSSASTFLAYAHSLGAAGVQVALDEGDPSEIRRVRELVERTGRYFEGQVDLPTDETGLATFDHRIRAIREAGGRLARTAVLGTRRYETVRSIAEWRTFRNLAHRRLAWVEPILRQHQVRLAVENHKDWLTPELIAALRHLDSEWIGACVDTGNNLALLEDPDEVVAALAPYAVSTHLKDMAVRQTDRGFLLAEIPFGRGFLDLPGMVRTLRRERPEVRLNLEMITRDPLIVPCLEPGYWDSFEDARASRLASALARVRRHADTDPLPTVRSLADAARRETEDDNVRQCLAWSRSALR